MQWEHACLVRNTTQTKGQNYTWVNTYTLHGPDGQKELTGTNGIEFLNDLGKEGWELVGVETNHFQYSSERTYWLKRPKSTGGAR